MIPTDETMRKQQHPITLPSLNDGSSFEWEIREFNHQVEMFEANVECGGLTNKEGPSGEV